MQIQIFHIPLDDTHVLEECNKFLRSHKIISVREEHCEATGSWHILIRYVGSMDVSSQKDKPKVDYKEILAPDAFVRFARLREVRNELAKEHSVPGYVIFTNEEVAQMAGCQELTLQELKAIKGIGEKRLATYGEAFMKKLLALKDA